jgi:hypothetical protein
MRQLILCLLLMSLLAPVTLAQGKRRAAKPPNREVTQPHVALPNRVTGSVTFEGTTVKFNHAYARPVPNDFDKSKQDALILFTEKPIPRNYFVEPGEDFLLWTVSRKADEGLLQGFEVRINAEKGIQFYRLHKKGLSLASFKGDFEPVMFTRSAVQGRLVGKGEFIKRQYEFDAEFKISLRPNEWSGEFYTPPPINLALGRASGQLVINGKATTFNHVYAQAEADFFDEKNNKLILLFTEKPVSGEASFKSGFTNYKNMQQAGNNYVVTYELSAGKADKEWIYIWEVGKLTGTASSIFARTIFHSDLDIQKSDDKEIQGRLFTELPEKLGEHTYEFNVAFHVTVESDSPNIPVTAKNGKPLAVGGGEPGKAFMAIAKALAVAKNARELAGALQSSLIARLAAELRPNAPATEVTKEMEAVAFQLLKFEIIENPQVTGGFIGDGKATLAVVGFQESPFQDDSPTQAKNKPAKKQKVSARINMHLENGQWKMGKRATQPAK